MWANTKFKKLKPIINRNFFRFPSALDHLPVGHTMAVRRSRRRGRNVDSTTPPPPSSPRGRSPAARSRSPHSSSKARGRSSSSTTTTTSSASSRSRSSSSKRRAPRLGPPTLYCDGETVIRRVYEDPATPGHFPHLKPGDRCMVPLNLARGLSQTLDTIVDQFAEFDLLKFHHHFICVSDTDACHARGETSFCAEFTNDPASFLKQTRAVGFSGAIMNKANFQRTPLSFYAGSVIYRIVDEDPPTPEERARIVETAEEAMKQSSAGEFLRYNLAAQNCEHVASAVVGAGRRGARSRLPGGSKGGADGGPDGSMQPGERDEMAASSTNCRYTEMKRTQRT